METSSIVERRAGSSPKGQSPFSREANGGKGTCCPLGKGQYSENAALQLFQDWLPCWTNPTLQSAPASGDLDEAWNP